MSLKGDDVYIYSQLNLHESYKMYYMYTFSLVIPKNLYFWKTQQELPIISCKQKTIAT